VGDAAQGIDPLCALGQWDFRRKGSPTVNAERILASCSAEVVELATAVALAVRVTPELLRRARLELVPTAPASAESELWFGPLVESFGPAGFVIRPQVANELRKRLADDNSRLQASWKLVSALHPWVSPALVAEERLIYLSLARGKRASKEMDDIFSSVLRSMAEAPARASQLARWALRALPRLPAAARSVDGASLLSAATSARLPAARLVGDGDVVSARALPRDLLAVVGRTEIRFDWYTGSLVFHDGGEHAIQVPTTQPLMIVVSWGRRHHRRIRHAVEPGKRVPVSAAATELTLESIDGDRWQLRRSDAPRRGDTAPRLPRARRFPGEGKWIGRRTQLGDFVRGIQKPGVSLLRAPRGGGKTTFLRSVMERYRRNDPSINWSWPMFLVGTDERDPEELRRDILLRAVEESGGDATGNERELIESFRASAHTIIALVDEQEPRTPSHGTRCLDALSRLTNEVSICVVLATSWPGVTTFGLPRLRIPGEVAQAIGLHELAYRDDYVRRILYLSGGNPGLIHLLVDELEWNANAVDPWNADRWGGRLGTHLRSLDQWFAKHPDAAADVRRVPGAMLDPELVERIASSGILDENLQFAAPVFRGARWLAHDYAIVHAEKDSSIASALASRLASPITIGEQNSNELEDLRTANCRAFLVSERFTASDKCMALLKRGRALGDFVPIYLDRIRPRELAGTNSLDMANGVDEVARQLRERDSRSISGEAVHEQVRVADVAPPSSQRVPEGESKTTSGVTFIRTLTGHTDGVTACAITPDGTRVVTTSHDRTVRVWGLTTGSRASFTGHSDFIYDCAITPDGARVVTASEDHTMRVWEVETGATVHELRGHTDAVRACAISPDGRHAVSASTDKTLRVWDLETGKSLYELRGHEGPVYGCLVTPRDRRIVSAGRDGALRVWSLDAGRSLAVMEEQGNDWLCCAVTPDGRELVSSGKDRDVVIWDLDTYEERASLHGHTEPVWTVATTPDGRYVVSGGDDRTIKLWDRTSGHMVASIDAHDGPVYCCVVMSDGRVVSTSKDGTVKLWTFGALSGLAESSRSTASVPIR
jgi:hypothetical protein